jgi:hypothetical protein
LRSGGDSSNGRTIFWIRGWEADELSWSLAAASPRPVPSEPMRSTAKRKKQASAEL